MTQAETEHGVALVTGAGRRIGRAIALDLARHGWRVVVHANRSAADAEAVVAEIAAAGGVGAALTADLSRADTIPTLVAQAGARLGPVQSLVNNAALFVEDDLATLDPDTWDMQHAVNLRAPILLAKAFAAALPAGLQGAIVNVVDQRVLRPTPGFLSYSVAKAGLYAATPMLAQALAPRIRVNAIGPGPVLPSIYQNDADFAAEVRGTLTGRPAAPEEIAAAVRFLLCSGSVTGQMLAVDGGQHLGRRAGD